MTQNPRKKRGINDVSDKVFCEAAKSSSDIEMALARMDVPTISGNVRKFRKRAKSLGLKLPYLKKEPAPPRRHRATRLSVPISELVKEKEKTSMKNLDGSIDEKIMAFPVEELRKHLKGATSLRQVFKSIGQEKFGGKNSIVLRDRLIELGLDYSDLQSVVRHRIGSVPDEEFKEIVEGFDSLDNVANYIGIHRLTPYVEKVLQTRIQEMQLTAGMGGKRDPHPAPPPPPTGPRSTGLNPVVEFLMEDEEELTEILQHKLAKLEAELEEVRKTIEAEQERRNELTKKINKLRDVVRGTSIV